MKKLNYNLGKVLNKTEQKTINEGDSHCKQAVNSYCLCPNWTLSSSNPSVCEYNTGLF